MKTKRLTLRQPGKQDASFIVELVNSPGWLEFIGDRNIKTETAALAYIHQIREDRRTKGIGLFVMERCDNAIAMGLCGLLQRDYLDAPDLGFAILPQYSGKGFTFEAAQHLLEQFQPKGTLPKVLAITHTKNRASQQLLLKLGFMRSEPLHDPKTGEPLDLYTKKTITDHQSQTIDNIL